MPNVNKKKKNRHYDVAPNLAVKQDKFMKIKTEKVIELQEWDDLVSKTYKRPYSFQQQDGCKDRGNFRFTVPVKKPSDFENETLPEVINHETRGVSFAAWLKRDPKQKLNDDDTKEQWGIDLWWERNFYPDFEMIANDLHKKGLLKAGSYTIDIDW